MQHVRHEPPRLELRGLTCLALEVGDLPPDPTDCAIFMDAEIGMQGLPGTHLFSFTAITPRAISGSQERSWGRGYLVIPAFSWDTLHAALNQLLTDCRADTWEDACELLNRTLVWEFGQAG